MTIPLPTGPFDIIYADPPRRFASNSVAKSGRNAMRHYDCMTIPDICAMPVAEIAARDALLLMWVTVPFAELAFSVVKAWDFACKSQLVWPKQRIATGYWARNQHELLYICRRGKFPCLRPALFPTSLIAGKQGVHSRKPEWVPGIVDARFPDARKIELFARASRPGWQVFGNEATRFDEVEVNG